MDSVQSLFRRQRGEQATSPNGADMVHIHTTVQLKLRDEIKRRLNSNKQTIALPRQESAASNLQSASDQLAEELRGETPQAVRETGGSEKQRHTEGAGMDTSPITPNIVPPLTTAQSTPVNMMPIQQTLQYTLLDPKKEHYKKICANFRRRCFLSEEEQEYFISDKVRLLLKEQCESCGKILFPKDIMKQTCRVEESEQSSGQSLQYIFRCICFQQIYPSLKVRIGDLHISKREDTLLINPVQLRQYLEERMQLDDSYRNAEQIAPEVLREHNKNIYWNLIWYFADNYLPYDFIVPYANDEPLWEDFVHTNDHIVVRNKVRLDQLCEKEGGIESHIRQMQERLQREEQIEAARKRERSGSAVRKGLKVKKKGVRKQESGVSEYTTDSNGNNIVKQH